MTHRDLEATVAEMRRLGVIEFAGIKLGPPPVARSQESQNDPKQEIAPAVLSPTPGLVPRERSNSD